MGVTRPFAAGLARGPGSFAIVPRHAVPLHSLLCSVHSAVRTM